MGSGEPCALKELAPSDHEGLAAGPGVTENSPTSRNSLTAIVKGRREDHAGSLPLSIPMALDGKYNPDEADQAAAVRTLTGPGEPYTVEGLVQGIHEGLAEELVPQMAKRTVSRGSPLRSREAAGTDPQGIHRPARMGALTLRRNLRCCEIAGDGLEGGGNRIPGGLAASSNAFIRLGSTGTRYRTSGMI